jgi:hypothetical protein
VKTFPVFSKGFEIETEMTIHAVNYNLRVVNVVIEYRDRPEGSVSKLNTVPDGIKVLHKLYTLYKNYRPMRFFGLLGTILILLAIGFLAPIVAEYGSTGLVPRFPTLIVCGFVGLSGVLSIFTGMILRAIDVRDRKDFEYRLVRVHDHRASQKRREQEKNG